MDEELKPCPHCGSRLVVIRDVPIGCFFAKCAKCGALGAVGRSREEAIELWNKRFGDTKLLFKDEYGVHDFAEWYKQEIRRGLWGASCCDYNDFEINKEAQELIQAAMAKPDDEGLKIIPCELERSLLKHSESFRDSVLEKLNLKSYNKCLSERQRALKKLKNCLFCGRHSLSVAALKADEGGYSGVVTCHHCGASVKTLNTYDTAQEAKEQAAFKWNKREGKEND